MSQKVYVIKPPKLDNRSASDGANGRSGAASRSRFTTPNTAVQTSLTPGERWARVLLAYLTGPLTLISRPNSRFRYYWAGTGLVSVAAIVYLLVNRSSVATLTELIPGGVFAWIALLSVAAVSATAVWARAVSLAGRDRPPLGAVSPDAVRHPVTVGLLGLLLPGLGYLLKGFTRRAAVVVLTMGLMVLSLVVLINWHRLWDGGRWVVSSGPSGLRLELVFIAAAAIAVLSALVWLVQAMDGGRRFSANRGPFAHNDLIALALLVVLVVFVSTVQPAPLAQAVAAAADGLHNNGLRLIPLGLYEAAARMDPACPNHIARAAVLNEQLGMRDAADAKYQLLERRMEQYVRAVESTLGPDGLIPIFSSLASRPLPGFERDPQDDTVRRINSLLRSEMKSPAGGAGSVR
jgi:hypothetical protein